MAVLVAGSAVAIMRQKGCPCWFDLVVMLMPSLRIFLRLALRIWVSRGQRKHLVLRSLLEVRGSTFMIGVCRPNASGEMEV